MHIFVRGLDGKAVRAEVEPDFTALDVKELVCHGVCTRSEKASVSKTLAVPPPHVRLMWACKELDDNSTLESSRVKSGMTLDLFACYLCAAQVYVQMDWERLGGPGLHGNGRRFLPNAWTRQNGTTAWHLRQWVASTCSIDVLDEVVVEGSDGLPISDDFSDWTSLLEEGVDGGVTVTAVRYIDAPCADVAVVVGEEIFPTTKEVLLRIPFFAAAIAGAGGDQCSRVEVNEVDLPTFRIVWRVICGEDHHEALLALLCDWASSADELWRILSAAHCLGMKSLHGVAMQRLDDLMTGSIAPDTAPAWVALAREHKAPQLAKAALDFVAKHGREVMLAMAGEDWSGDLASYETIVLAALNDTVHQSSCPNGGA